MRTEIWHCGKKVKNPYDPQIGAAALKESETADNSVKWSQDYFEKYVAPMVEQMTKESAQNQTRQDQMYADNRENMQMAQDRYKKYGIPAEDRYFKMAADYSAPAEEERQATLALGDQRVAEQGQRATVNRNLAAMGIDPTSPAAISAANDAAVMGAAQQAGAATRARQAAKAIGMQLTGDAANFGRGGQSAVLGFGQAASGNAAAGFGGSTQAVGAAGQGAAVPLQGYGLGLKGYGDVMGNYVSAGNASMQANAQAQGAPWQALGTGLGMLAAAKL